MEQEEKIAKKIIEVTEPMWLECNEFNRMMIEEYLDTASHLSKQSKKQYTSALHIFAYWLKKYCFDKKIVDVKSLDYARYQNWLMTNEGSSSMVQLKRTAINNLNNHILVYHEEDFPKFRNFINKSIKVQETGEVHKKIPPTPQEYKHLCDELEKREEWQKLAYLKFTYSSSCRREESHQLLKEVVSYNAITKTIKVKDKNKKEKEVVSVSYKTHDIRAKGKGKIGKVRQFQFDEDAMIALKKWVEVRGEDDCPYMFVVKLKKNGQCTQCSAKVFNNWCNGLFAEIVGRRIHPHIWREARATNIVVHEGKSIDVAKKLLGHVSSATTETYVIRQDTNDADEAFY